MRLREEKRMLAADFGEAKRHLHDIEATVSAMKGQSAKEIAQY